MKIRRTKDRPPHECHQNNPKSLFRRFGHGCFICDHCGPYVAVRAAASSHDKLYHGIAFAALTFPICSFRPSGNIIILSLAALFGAMIEIIQPLVGRQGDIMDFWADVVGICLGWSLAQIYLRLCIWAHK
jgi:hypothetical protein